MKFTLTNIFVVLTLLAHVVLAVFPNRFIELYQDYLFASMRILYDFTLGFSPFPFLYMMVALIVYYFIIKIRRENPFHGESLRSGFTGLLRKLSAFTIVMVCVFYWIWGFNYYQKNLNARMKLDKVIIDSVYIQTEITKVIPRLNALRQHVAEDDIIALAGDSFCVMEKQIRKNQVVTLRHMGWKPVGKVRVRKLVPEGFLLGWSTAGIYIPFTFEGHLDPGLHPLQYPFTLAHEMAHGYGVTNEGDCNTIALVTCLQTGNPLYEYAALLTYFRYLWFDSRWTESNRNKVSGAISPEVRQDLTEIRNQADKFPDFWPEWRDIVYEAYLYWMGVDDGLESYHSIVDKMAALHKQYPALTQYK